MEATPKILKLWNEINIVSYHSETNATANHREKKKRRMGNVEEGKHILFL